MQSLKTLDCFYRAKTDAILLVEFFELNEIGCRWKRLCSLKVDQFRTIC